MALNLELASPDFNRTLRDLELFVGELPSHEWQGYRRTKKLAERLTPT